MTKDSTSQESSFKVVVLVSGGGTNLQAIIDAKESGNLGTAEISCVVSNNPNAYALQRAKAHGIPSLCICPSDYPDRKQFEDALLSALKEREPDLIVLAGFLLILPSIVIKAYEGRIINIHPSLIPSFCGKGFYGIHVHEAALERGVKISGATVHIVDEGTDTGPILLQKAVEVEEGDTPAPI